MSERAVAAALAVAREQGVGCDDPVVLREAWHVLVRLRPSPVVARVSTPIPFPQASNPDDIARELVTARRPDVAGQPLHGDAHLFNVLGTPRGPLWHDSRLRVTGRASTTWPHSRRTLHSTRTVRTTTTSSKQCGRTTPAG